MATSQSSLSRGSSFSMVLFQIKDYKDFSYQEMSASVEFHLGAILENESLQLALRGLLNEENTKGIKELLEYCKKAGGLLGHRKDILTTSVDNILTQLSVREVSQTVKEMQALQLFSEALTSFPPQLVRQIINLSTSQRQKLLRQFNGTPCDTNVHSFADKGAWVDPSLQPILEDIGYKIVNGHLQLRRDNYNPKDTVRVATLAVLSVDIILSDLDVINRKS